MNKCHCLVILLDNLDEDGGGGFFLAGEDFGRMFDNLFPACAFFFFLVSGDKLEQTNSTV